MTILNGLLAAEVQSVAYSGAAFPPEELQVRDSGGTPWDLTGKLVEWIVKAYDDAAGTPLINIRSDAGSGDRIEILNAAQGRFRRTVSQSTLAGLPRAGTDTNEFTRFRHELYIAGVLYCYGDFLVRGDVR